ncbi:SDR family NAD(P)-dependent oxidoreductase [Rhodococcoides kyotonense]|uniref:Short-chain dehydrogenase n=1 Tax=Rhodococcoides kyotonense TaxID=398843 RepID=A0A177Y7U7_9NOCA|nr:SDR family oxidoreductase [Rhodococcus kyotonensis]OAK51218.1 short-chain dehydrogenase [Rhodococcus kyotonensis]
MTILDKFRLDGRVAIVADAETATGVTFAAALAQAGADVVVAGRNAGNLDNAAHAVRSADRKAVTIEFDITDPKACTALVNSTIDEFGRVDILANNAEVGSTSAAIGENVAQFKAVLDTNLNGAYWLARACGRVMQPGSSIVNVSSVLAITTTGLPHAAFSASKSALIGLTRDLAQQWGTRKGIRVNAIAPGFFSRAIGSGYTDSYFEKNSHRLVLGRTGHLDELASTLIWLASDAGGYLTGQTLAVDGGVSIT